MAKSLADGDAVLVTFSGLFIVTVNLCSLTQCFLLPATVMPLSFPEIWASWLVKLAHEPRGMPRGEGICKVMLCTVTTSHSKVSSSHKGFTRVFRCFECSNTCSKYLQSGNRFQNSLERCGPTSTSALASWGAECMRTWLGYLDL